MSENPFAKKVCVRVKPCFDTNPDSERRYYVKLYLSPLELQLRGEKFALVARKALRGVLENGKAVVYDACDEENKAAQDAGSRFFDFRPVSPEDIVILDDWWS